MGGTAAAAHPEVSAPNAFKISGNLQGIEAARAKAARWYRYSGFCGK
jgi:hypothetical protein